VKDASAAKPAAEPKTEARQPGRAAARGQPPVSMIALSPDAASRIPGMAWMPKAQRVAGNQFVERQMARQQGEGQQRAGVTRSPAVPRPMRRAAARALRVAAVEPGSPINAIQRYAVGARPNASCETVVNWLNANSPHRPAWALTRATFSFSNIEFSLSGTAPDFSATMSGTVAVRKRVDMPMWRPRSAGMQEAWQGMWDQLRAHEAEHEAIADQWKATIQERIGDWSADFSAGNRRAAMIEAHRRFEEDKNGWIQEHQDAQNAIDPYFAALVCPEEPATVAPNRLQRSGLLEANAGRAVTSGTRRQVAPALARPRSPNSRNEVRDPRPVLAVGASSLIHRWEDESLGRPPAGPTAERPRESTAAAWRGTVGEGLIDELRWELGLVDEIDIMDRALDLARYNPRPSAEVQTPEEAFFFFLGWRVPWVQAGPSAGRLIIALRQLGVRNVRTLAGLRVRLISLFSGLLSRGVEMNMHVAKRFLGRCLTQGGALEGVTFSHLRNTIRFGRYFRDATSGNVVAVLDRTAIVMTVRGGGGRVIIRTIEPATQFATASARFTPIANPF